MQYIRSMKNILLFTTILLLTGCTPEGDFSNKKEEERKDTLNTTIDDWKPGTSSDVTVDDEEKE